MSFASLLDSFAKAPVPETKNEQPVIVERRNQNPNCPVPSQTRTAASKPSSEQQAPPPEYVCRLCGVGGHYIRECSISIDANEAAMRKKKPPDGYTCNLCGQGDHYLRWCHLAGKKKKQAVARAAASPRAATSPRPAASPDTERAAPKRGREDFYGQRAWNYDDFSEEDPPAKVQRATFNCKAWKRQLENKSLVEVVACAKKKPDWVAAAMCLQRVDELVRHRRAPLSESEEPLVYELVLELVRRPKEDVNLLSVALLSRTAKTLPAVARPVVLGVVREAALKLMPAHTDYSMCSYSVIALNLAGFLEDAAFFTQIAKLAAQRAATLRKQDFASLAQAFSRCPADPGAVDAMFAAATAATVVKASSWHLLDLKPTVGGLTRFYAKREIPPSVAAFLEAACVEFLAKVSDLLGPALNNLLGDADEVAGNARLLGEVPAPSGPQLGRAIAKHLVSSFRCEQSNGAEICAVLAALCYEGEQEAPLKEAATHEFLEEASRRLGQLTLLPSELASSLSSLARVPVARRKSAGRYVGFRDGELIEALTRRAETASFTTGELAEFLEALAHFGPRKSSTRFVQIACADLLKKKNSFVGDDLISVANSIALLDVRCKEADLLVQRVWRETNSGSNSTSPALLTVWHYAACIRDIVTDAGASLPTEARNFFARRDRLSTLLDEQGWHHLDEYVIPGLAVPPLRMAQPATRTAVELLGPEHYLFDGHGNEGLNGAPRFKARLMRSLGWNLVTVSFHQYPSDDTGKVRRLVRGVLDDLKSHGAQLALTEEEEQDIEDLL